MTVRGFISHPLVARLSRAKEHARAARCHVVQSAARACACVSFARRLPLLVYSLLSHREEGASPLTLVCVEYKDGLVCPMQLE